MGEWMHGCMEGRIRSLSLVTALSFLASAAKKMNSCACVCVLHIALFRVKHAIADQCFQIERERGRQMMSSSFRELAKPGIRSDIIAHSHRSTENASIAEISHRSLARH
jgi:hypothetical protein